MMKEIGENMHYDAEAIRRFLLDDRPDPALAAHLCVCAECRRIYERMRDASELFSSEAISAGITLTPGQWIYCAAVIGCDTFEGMPDVFRHSDDAARDAAYSLAQSELANKKLIEVSFDGSIGIAKRLYDIADICVHFRRFISLTRRTPGKPERICNIYERDGNSVIMYVNVKKGCTAVKRDGKVFFADMPDIVPLAQGERYSYDELRSLHSDIKGFGEPSDTKGAKAALTQAMCGSAEYYSIIEIITNPGNLGHLRSTAFISTHDAGYEVLCEPGGFVELFLTDERYR